MFIQIPVPESTMSSGKQELVSPSKKNLASMSMYQSPYQGRSGGGYPIFTEERILDRKFKVSSHLKIDNINALNCMNKKDVVFVKAT